MSDGFKNGVLNTSLTGVLTGNGDGSNTTASAVTNHNVLVGAASNLINSVPPSTSGFVLTSNGASADPSFQSASASGAITTITGNSGGAESPSAGNFNIVGTGSITVAGTANTETVQLTGLTNHNVLLGAGTSTITNVAPSATSGVPLISQGSSADPLFGTALVGGGGTGNITQAAYSLVCGGTTTTGAFQGISPVATGQVLISSGTSALPAFSAYPQVTGIGVGASPGSTTGLTFDGTNFMSAYATGSFTPAVAFGGGTTGITYTTQFGAYYKIGAVVFVNINIVLSNKGSSTGACTVTGLPFTGSSGSNNPLIIQLSGVTFTALYTYPICVVVAGATTANVNQGGSGQSTTSIPDTGFTNTSSIRITGFYFT